MSWGTGAGLMKARELLLVARTTPRVAHDDFDVVRGHQNAKEGSRDAAEGGRHQPEARSLSYVEYELWWWKKRGLNTAKILDFNSSGANPWRQNQPCGKRHHNLTFN